MSDSLFIFGQGYVGNHLAQIANCEVVGTHSKQPVLFNEKISEIDLEKLLNYTHILISIPPINGQDIVYNQLLTTLQNSKRLQWLGYLSTIGVYGNTDGAWVDESSATITTETHSIHRMQIEQLWLATNLPIHIFRLGAIYGPGRSIIEQIRANTLRIIHREGQVFNRIHVDDLCQALIKSMTKPSTGAIYNLVDDCPASSFEVAQYVCDLLAAPMPEVEDYLAADISDYHRSYFMNCRRVKNDKMKNELSVSLKYPTYKEAMAMMI